MKRNAALPRKQRTFPLSNTLLLREMKTFGSLYHVCNAFHDVVASSKNLSRIHGVGCSIGSINYRLNGFHPGELVCLFGPSFEINLAFLADLMLFVTLHQQKKVDFIACHSNINATLRERFSLLNQERYDGLLKYLTQTTSKGSRSLLHVPELHLGDSTTKGWQMYCSNVKKSKPDIIILDGVENIELFHDVKNTANQLKVMAMKLKIPIVVLAPTQQTVEALDNETELQMRDDFDDVCKVGIGLFPQFGRNKDDWTTK